MVWRRATRPEALGRAQSSCEAGTTLEIRDPHLLQIEAAKDWEADAAHAKGEGAAVASAGYHLLRVENPAATLRINGHAVRPARPPAARTAAAAAGAPARG